MFVDNTKCKDRIRWFVIYVVVGFAAALLYRCFKN